VPVALRSRFGGHVTMARTSRKLGSSTFIFFKTFRDVCCYPYMLIATGVLIAALHATSDLPCALARYEPYGFQDVCI
jgi:hypothetical protein